ncbi:MAG: hypothetical protein ABI325_09445 [Ginsengibacter sp.]
MKKYIFPSILFLFFAPLLRGQEIDFKKTMDRLQDNVQETTYEGVEDGWYGVMDIPDLLFLTIIQDKDLYYINVY